MLRRAVTLILVFAIVFFGITPSASAMPANTLPETGELSLSTGEKAGYFIKGTTDGVKRCFVGQPENGLEEVSCDFLKAGTVVAACYGIDALASLAFPPAVALLPVCDIVSLGAIGGKKVFDKGLKYIPH